MSIPSSMPTTTRVSRSRTALARAAGALAIVAVIAACSSAATPAATPTPTPTPTAATVATPEVVVTPSPSPTATPPATASPTDTGPVVTAPPGTPALVDPFISAGISTTIDSAAHAVDPSTYRTTIPGKDYTSVYVVFALKPDVVGKVTMVMTFGDVDVLDKPLTIDYQKVNSWGDFKVNFDPSAGIPPGVYKATVTYEPTGAEIVQFFTVN